MARFLFLALFSFSLHAQTFDKILVITGNVAPHVRCSRERSKTRIVIARSSRRPSSTSRNAAGTSDRSIDVTKNVCCGGSGGSGGSSHGTGQRPVTPRTTTGVSLMFVTATVTTQIEPNAPRVSPGSIGTLPFTDQRLAELHPTFTIPVQGGGTQQHPGYAAIPLRLLPELAGAERVRIVIEPLDASGDYWAFVSSTHNETQHVTVLAPR